MLEAYLLRAQRPAVVAVVPFVGGGEDAAKEDGVVEGAAVVRDRQEGLGVRL